MSKSERFITSCIVGGIIGMAIALAMPQIIWWLGAVAGGLAGGIIYAIPDAIRHSPRVAQTAWHSLTYAPKVAWTTGKVIVVIATGMLFMFSLLPKMSKNERLVVANSWAAIALAAGLFYFLIFSFPPEIAKRENVGIVVLSIWVFYLIYLAIMAFRGYFGPLSTSGQKEWDRASDQKKIDLRKKNLFYMSPFGVILLVAVKVVPFLFKIGWELCKFIAKFSRTLFILVHSKEMVLVAFDTTFGVIATYLLFVRNGEPLLGAGPTIVLSGLISVSLGYLLDYQIISKRVLHLNGRR